MQIHTTYTDDEFACVDECRADGACTWMTYLREFNLWWGHFSNLEIFWIRCELILLPLCSELLENCDSIDGGFSDAVSAPKFCSNSTDEGNLILSHFNILWILTCTSTTDPLHIMVALGRSSTGYHMDDIEIVDIGSGTPKCYIWMWRGVKWAFFHSGSSSCTKPPAYPVELEFAAGAFIDGKARICGDQLMEGKILPTATSTQWETTLGRSPNSRSRRRDLAMQVWHERWHFAG